MRCVGSLLLFAVLSCMASCVAPRGAPERVTLDAREHATGPRVLVVIAHPDDETAFAGALYKVTTHLDGVCDVVVITNGEGGFKYSTLAERIYGVELTDERVGRAELPAIRRREMLDGASVLGVRSVEFLAERDHRYTTDLAEVLGPDARVWDLARVRATLARKLSDVRYDFVFALRPTKATHAHHQAATLLAREAVLAEPETRRPTLLIGSVSSPSEPSSDPSAPSSEPGAPSSEPGTPNSEPGTPADDDLPPADFHFDRLQRFGFQSKLDYRVVVNWEIAAHKSQGTMQLAMSRGEREDFALWGTESPADVAAATELFARLAEPQFESKTYGASAGVETETKR